VHESNADISRRRAIAPRCALAVLSDARIAFGAPGFVTPLFRHLTVRHRYGDRGRASPRLLGLAINVLTARICGLDGYWSPATVSPIPTPRSPSSMPIDGCAAPETGRGSLFTFDG